MSIGLVLAVRAIVIAEVDIFYHNSDSGFGSSYGYGYDYGYGFSGFSMRENLL